MPAKRGRRYEFPDGTSLDEQRALVEAEMAEFDARNAYLFDLPDEVVITSDRELDEETLDAIREWLTTPNAGTSVPYGRNEAPQRLRVIPDASEGEPHG